MSQAEWTQHLESLVFDELKPVSYKYFAQDAEIPVNMSKRLLAEFVEKNKSKLQVVFLLSGRARSGGGMHSAVLHQVQLVPQQNLDEARAALDVVVSVHVYSVQVAGKSHQQQDISTTVGANDLEQRRMFYQEADIMSTNPLRDGRCSAVEASFISRSKTLERLIPKDKSVSMTRKSSKSFLKRKQGSPVVRSPSGGGSKTASKTSKTTSNPKGASSFFGGNASKKAASPPLASSSSSSSSAAPAPSSAASDSTKEPVKKKPKPKGMLGFFAKQTEMMVKAKKGNPQEVASSSAQDKESSSPPKKVAVDDSEASVTSTQSSESSMASSKKSGSGTKRKKSQKKSKKSKKHKTPPSAKAKTFEDSSNVYDEEEDDVPKTMSLDDPFEDEPEEDEEEAQPADAQDAYDLIDEDTKTHFEQFFASAPAPKRTVKRKAVNTYKDTKGYMVFEEVSEEEVVEPTAEELEQTRLDRERKDKAIRERKEREAAAKRAQIDAKKKAAQEKRAAKKAAKQAAKDAAEAGIEIGNNGKENVDASEAEVVEAPVVRKNSKKVVPKNQKGIMSFFGGSKPSK